MMLHTEEEIRASISERIASKKYWIIPWVGVNAARMSALIEETFYSTPKKAVHFDVAMIPSSGLLGISFAKKSLAPARRLAKAIMDHSTPIGPISLESLLRSLTDQDILMFPEAATPEEYQSVFARMIYFERWLKGQPPLEVNLN